MPGMLLRLAAPFISLIFLVIQSYRVETKKDLVRRNEVLATLENDFKGKNDIEKEIEATKAEVNNHALLLNKG